MDALWKNVYIPAIDAVGLSPKRIDVHERGELLILQIKRYIEESRLIIADLTNEKPRERTPSPMRVAAGRKSGKKGGRNTTSPYKSGIFFALTVTISAYGPH